MFKEFRDFINKGNVMDLAIGIIIGAAFTAIVNSLVNDIVMPIIGIILGGIDFSTLAVEIFSVTISYGLFLQSLVNFLIISYVVFLIIRTLNRLQPKKPVETKPAEEIVLLTEIRDALKMK